MNRLLLILFGLILSSCSGLSRNLKQSGTVRFNDGRFEQESWKEDLVMQRHSWTQELNLTYDLMIMRLTDKSPFFKWLSPRNQEVLKQCKDSFIGLSFIPTFKRVDNSVFRTAFIKANLDQMKIPRFESHLRMHPDFESQYLVLYETFALCSKESRIRKIHMAVPGFKSTSLEFP